MFDAGGWFPFGSFASSSPAIKSMQWELISPDPIKPGSLRLRPPRPKTQVCRGQHPAPGKLSPCSPFQSCLLMLFGSCCFSAHCCELLGGNLPPRLSGCSNPPPRSLTQVQVFIISTITKLRVFLCSFFYTECLFNRLASFN